MTIQRHYDLPNCRLIIEGWSSDATDSSGRPVLSMVTNAECHIAGYTHPLKGGKAFIHGLAHTVNTYAQGLLSNIPRDSASAGVRLNRLGLNRHQLIVQPEGGATNGSASEGQANATGVVEPQQLELTTVQLFDLAEAVDQLVADTQTLPDLVLPLSSVSRRSVVSQEPLAQRAIPAALGVSSLVAAAIALFFVPTPEFRPTETEVNPAGEEQVDGAAETRDIGADGPDPVDSASGQEAESEAQAEPQAVSDGPEVSRDSALDGSSAAPDAPSPSSVGDDAIDELFTNAAPLSDSDQIDALVPQLQRSISQAWEGTSETDENLVYRVGTDEDGTIIGFKHVNDPALEYADQTPLLELTQTPQLGRELESIGQFRVVLRPSGVVEVSPWYGRPPGE
ncbi:MAG: DUF4335 domain-containing protein [Elainellaceae cyanobacterium]